MRAFVFVVFMWVLIRALASLARLAEDSFPMTRRTSAAEEVGNLVIALVFLIWGFVVLWC